METPGDRRALEDDAPHLLVIDDDNRIRTLLARFLGEHGYRVTTAGNAAEARRRLDGLAFDLLVVDVMMPGENGMDLTRSLRKTMDVPILMLTARGETESASRGSSSAPTTISPSPSTRASCFCASTTSSSAACRRRRR